MGWYLASLQWHAPAASGNISALDRWTLIVTCLQHFGIIEYVLYCSYIANLGAARCYPVTYHIQIKFWILCSVCDGINSGCRWNHADIGKVLHVMAQLQIDACYGSDIIICWWPCVGLCDSRSGVYGLWVGYNVPYICVLEFWIMYTRSAWFFYWLE